MVLFSAKKKSYLILTTVIIVLLFSIPTEKKFYQYEIWNLFDDIESYDHGFSSIYGFVGGGVTSLDSYSRIFSNSPKILKNLIFGFKDRPEIKRLDLEIKFKNFKKILEDRERSIKNDIGIAFQEVKGKISFEGKTINSKVRLKGDLKPHWRSVKRMSFRVSLKGDNTIFGFKRFSIHKPSARQHPYDQTFQTMQNKLENIAPKQKYIHLFVNGEDWGIMNVEEHMSKELLEKQQAKESLILKFGDERNWRYAWNNDSVYQGYRLSDPRLNIKAFSFDKYKDQEIFRRWYSYISKEHLKYNHSLYDNDSFTKSLLLAMTWNTAHTLESANSRYYFNPYTLKLYPITTDQGRFTLIEDKIKLPSIYLNLIQNPYFKLNFNKNSQKVKDVIDDSQNTINYWQSFFPIDKKINTKTLLKNNIEVRKRFDSLFLKDNSKQTFLKPPSEGESKNLQDHIHARHYENGEIHVFNLINGEVEIDSITIDDKKVNQFENIVIDGHRNSYSPYILKTQLNGILDGKIKIYTKNNAFLRRYEIDYTHLVNNLHNPLLQKSNLNNLKFINKKNDSTFFIKKGNWNIYKPIIIDGDLEIEKGTTLNFDKDSYLIIKGSAKLVGTKKEKIILTSMNGFWKGIYVFESRNRSFLKNVMIENTDFFKDGLLSLTGAINFYESDVTIVDTYFKNSIAEDALNIIKSDFLLDGITIDVSISDGFDSDFSTGLIKNSNFKNINGDGVDFSGSSVQIENCVFYSIKDKAVSSGEGSDLKLNNLSINDIGVGVASKDGSNTIAENLKISNYKLNALMTYTKKSFYEKPSLIANNLIVDSLNNLFSRQQGTNMIVDGFEIEEVVIDVDRMYESGLMKK